MGPGDLSLSLGSVKLLRDPYPPVMQAARDKVFAACRRNGIAFLEGCTPANIAARLDEGVRVIAGHSEETARIGRAHQSRGCRFSRRRATDGGMPLPVRADHRPARADPLGYCQTAPKSAPTVAPVPLSGRLPASSPGGTNHGRHRHSVRVHRRHPVGRTAARGREPCAFPGPRPGRQHRPSPA